MNHNIQKIIFLGIFFLASQTIVCSSHQPNNGPANAMIFIGGVTVGLTSLVEQATKQTSPELTGLCVAGSLCTLVGFFLINKNKNDSKKFGLSAQPNFAGTAQTSSSSSIPLAKAYPVGQNVHENYVVSDENDFHCNNSSAYNPYYKEN